MRFGYQGLVISDMVSVTGQNGQAASSETFAYHGIFAGLELRR